MINEKYLNIGEDEDISFSIFEIFMFACIYEKKYKILKFLLEKEYIFFTNTIKRLEYLGYIKQTGENIEDIVMRKAGESIFLKYNNDIKENEGGNVKTWIDEWRNIFPSGLTDAGYRYRGDKTECLKKMTKFVKENPEYSTSDILKATKSYVERFRIKGYKFMQQAHYFIDKKGSGSNLLSECEALKKKPETETKPNHGQKLI